MRRLNLTPHAATRHWSAQYVGRAWSEDFDCWALVRVVQALHFGRRLPFNPQVEVPGWRTVAGPAIEGDVITMQGVKGPHIGVMVDAHRVLHNVGGPDDNGAPHGAVQIDDAAALSAQGYGRLRLWRPA
jgi:cell wall-associated NlpC family hydrolase